MFWWKYLVPASKADVEEIIMRVSELGAHLTRLGDQVEKIAEEVRKLADTLTDVELPADAHASLARLEGLIQVVDDLNADVTAPVEPEPLPDV